MVCKSVDFLAFIWPFGSIFSIVCKLTDWFFSFFNFEKGQFNDDYFNNENEDTNKIVKLYNPLYLLL